MTAKFLCIIFLSGGAKGISHIGILPVVDSAGLKIDYLTGTSMGSIIVALYATGYSADGIHCNVFTRNWYGLLPC